MRGHRDAADVKERGTTLFAGRVFSEQFRAYEICIYMYLDFSSYKAPCANYHIHIDTPVFAHYVRTSIHIYIGYPNITASSPLYQIR